MNIDILIIPNTPNFTEGCNFCSFTSQRKGII